MKSPLAIACSYFVEDWLRIRLPFRNYEAVLLEFARASLDADNRRRLSADLTNVRRVSRFNEGRMVLLLPRARTEAAGFDGAEDNILATCRLRAVNSKTTIKARLIAYSGRLHRMEFSPSPHALWDEALTAEAAPGLGRSRLAEKIDREEHG